MRQKHEVCLWSCVPPCLRSRRRQHQALFILCFITGLLLVIAYRGGPRDFSTPIPVSHVDLGNSCQSEKNVVFLKVHKCASSTIANILVRRGLYVDHAVFGLPKQDPAHIGWPHSILPHHVLHPLHKQPNLITHHLIYNRTTLENLMPAKTRYVSIVREPFSHFQSTMHYFRELHQLGLSSHDKAAEFLKSPRRYEKKVRMYIKVSPPAYFSLTRNLMSTEFGLPAESVENRSQIEHFVKKIDEEFDLVLIYEYFYESIILLRRLLCWRFRDVTFRTVNFKFQYSSYGSSRERKQYQRWSMADHLLYRKLNRTFWQKIRAQKSDFSAEVLHLRQVNELVRHYCARIDSSPSDLIVKTSPFNDLFTISASDCLDMKKRPDEFYYQMLRSNYNWPETLWIYIYHHLFQFS